MRVQNILIAVGKILRINAIRNHKQLDKMIEALVRVLAVTHNLVDRFLNVHATPFQLDLHKRQTIYKNCNIVTICILAHDCRLICYLEDILRKVLVQERNIDFGGIIQF